MSVVEEYLRKAACLPFEVAPDAASNAALVVVETRPLPALPRVVATAVQTHPGWHLYVFGTPGVHDLLGRHCVDYGRVNRVTLAAAAGMSVSEYSHLLMSPAFWDVIRQEHVLVFQADCVLVRPCPAPALAYDFVGAVCGVLDPAAFVMNGGLSLRRRSAMVEAVRLLRDHHPELLDEPEDVAFCKLMRSYPFFVLPSMETCLDFAIETLGNPATAVGMHGTDKGYAAPELVARLLKNENHVA